MARKIGRIIGGMLGILYLFYIILVNLFVLPCVVIYIIIESLWMEKEESDAVYKWGRIMQVFGIKVTFNEEE